MGILAGLILLVELGNPRNVYLLLSGLRHAWISRGTLLIALCIVFGLAYALPTLPLFAWLPWHPATALGRALGIVAAVSGFFLMLYPGFLLASFKPIPLWHSALSPVLSMSTSALSGIGLAFLLAPFAPATGDVSALRTLSNATMAIILLQMAILWAYVDTARRGGVTEAESARLLLKMPAFIIGSIIAGAVAPLILLLLSLTTSDPAALTALYGIAGVLLLAGALSTRYAILAAGVRIRWQPA